jgi:hypothetical protein
MPLQLIISPSIKGKNENEGLFGTGSKVKE